MDYADLARGIYTPYFSGEDIQYGNYPTRMTPKNSQNDTYTQLASNMYLPFMQGMSGEDIQRLLDSLQQIAPVSVAPTSTTPQNVPSAPTGYSGSPIGMISPGTGGNSISNPAFKMITKGAEDIIKQMVGGGQLAQSGLTMAGSPMSEEVTEAAGLTGGSGFGTAISGGPGPLAGISMLGAWGSAAAPPMYSPVARGLSYVPLVGSLLGGMWEAGSELFGDLGPPAPTPSYLRQNAAIGQTQVGRLNQLLGQQPGAAQVPNPTEVGAYDPNRSWMQSLYSTPQGKEAMGFESYPYVPSTGISVDSDEYKRLLEQLAAYNATMGFYDQLSPIMGTQYYDNPAAWAGGAYTGGPSSMVDYSGYVSGLQTPGEQYATAMAYGGEQSLPWLGLSYDPSGFISGMGPGPGAYSPWG